MTKRQSSDPKAKLDHALRTLGRGQYKPALRQLEKLLPLVQADSALSEQVHLAMADAYLNLRELPSAIRHAETAIELNSESYWGYYLLGFSYSVNENWPQAVSALRQAMALKPDEVEYYRSLGWALYNQGEAKQEGQELLEKALSMAPTHIPILTDLAVLHSQEQRFDQAVIFARRAVELAPSDPMARKVLANLSYVKQEFERLGGQSASKKLPSKPSTEAEWRELIAGSGDFNQVMQLWFDLHPAKDIDEINASLQQFNELWNSTPRPELGGRSPNEMIRGR
jgi:tetratricopeptide (TPR) repeat protein